VLAGWYPFDDAWAQATFTLGMDVFVVNPQGGLVGMISATSDDGFDKRVDVGPFDFLGAYDSFTYSSNSALFVNGIGISAGNHVFFPVWAELDVDNDLEPVLDEVAHHRSAHDANADDADAPGHHSLPNRLPGQQTAIAHPRQDRR
jgi:hypothetical protein